MSKKQLRTLDDIDVKGKRILYRAAYDITLFKRNGKYIAEDDSRIKGTMPTIKYLLEKGCRIAIVTWLKRPNGEVIEKYRLAPIAERLSELLRMHVKSLKDCVGPKVESAVNNLKPGEIVMLENTRFHKEEQAADQAFAKELAKAGDIIVYDAFAQSHRVHASTTGILKEKPAVAGFLMKNELDVLMKIIESPMKPFVVVVGGAKISDKIDAIKNILPKADMVLVGGALGNIFSKARGFEVGGSFIESQFMNASKNVEIDPVKVAREIIDKGDEGEVPRELMPDSWPNGEEQKLYKMQLPFDVVIARKRDDGTYDADTLKIEKVNGRKELCGPGEAILDIGPLTRTIYNYIIKKARTIFWNGPMGLFEDFDFSHGTREVAESIAASNGYSVIGGGDTEAAISKYDLHGRFGHVSTGGGASLDLLAGEEFPVFKYISK